MQTIREALSARNYERFEANKRFEEVTDIAERIGYAIDTTISYELRGGALYALTDTKDRPFHAQTEQAKHEGRSTFTGNQAFEYERLSLEHEEALFVDAFARGEVDADIVMKLSRVPDAVASGTTDIKGYRRDLLRSFVRLYYKEDGLVQCRLFTLDGNNQKGLEEVGAALGISVQNKTSEEILAATGLRRVDDVVDYVDMLSGYVKDMYDRAVQATTGQHTKAGSRFIDKNDAHALVSSKCFLVDQHMQAVAGIQARLLDPNVSDSLLEIERRRTAAAIHLALDGLDVRSSSDGVVSAEVQANNYGRECATGSTQEQMGMAQARVEHWKVGKCRSCPDTTLVGECSICRNCQERYDRGEDPYAEYQKILARQAKIHRNNTQNVHVGKSAEKPKKLLRPALRSQGVRQKYGEHAKVRSEIGIGTAYTVVYDRRTDEVMARF